MPQKRNPDVAELARGKSGRLIGNLTALLTLLKGLPTGYNRDLQEDKASLFDTVDTLLLTLPAVAGAVRTAKLEGARMEADMDAQLVATDLADYLVRKGVPFRTSHEVIGRLVRRAETQGVALSALTLDELRAEHSAFEADTRSVFDWRASTEARDVAGGTSARAIRAQLDEAAGRIAALAG
jgi:argininosuccinate lyase